jgi:ribosomal protein L40E
MEDNTRICRRCGHRRPMTEFRRRCKNDDSRASSCRQCHASYMRSYRDHKRNKRLSKFFSDLRWQKNATTLIALSDELLRKFGGFEGLADQWVRVMERAEAKGDLLTVGKCLDSAIHLIELHDRFLETGRISTRTDTTI